ncbi:MAG: hypothetical protein A2566_03810 [Candidatus Zambryskibacteria bacterium RIFOXYD1_FULL_40_13]|nr:MAG: Acetate kinase [Parcubacteria group bacterium GW2011_GWC1_39_12]KKR19266.1 MAG: Acetate kinase [Parcubacteria group bacterium GW2011_GWF1_39_37]KKR35351.1 MAG: Acetate kinase [Parcubacteria group bacterium GW2011_GWC2_40_10]KKR52217.1 MAG: Acetate kinase [Parcubacteria group bacterium GW2011_GWE1_40_20]KKR65715.1 MAG: Acetate kinase [Parcubacteria group bacterium GW2011_GWB1_40_5]KKR69259.1 MAG: Acetate kinase [Parcubacteria group bacterium GW2011_GWF2_40_69]KKR81056.1 MAG: Acetate ki
MEKNILAINIGSSSKKYHFFSDESLLSSAHFERDNERHIVTYRGGEEQEINSETYENSLESFYETLKTGGQVSDEKPVSAIGLRLVAPGEYFAKDNLVNEEFIKNLETIAKSDPTHIVPVQTELGFVSKLFPGINIVAVSDSRFHSTMSQVARQYAIPEKLAKEKDIYRFGFHGISVASIVHDLLSRPSSIEKKVVVCHLGSGASITAVLDGKSVDTSMGYSPLEGLIMSSRVGNIDAGAVLRLLDETSPDELHKLFYFQSGLLALSGLSDDMRVLLSAEKEGHSGAHLAIESFVYAVRKYIGAYATVLHGLDAIVFSGTMGERAFLVRERICSNLEYLNIHIDLEKNKVAVGGTNIASSGIPIYIVNVDEAGEIMRRTALL